jgi:hypothetical protein
MGAAAYLNNTALVQRPLYLSVETAVRGAGMNVAFVHTALQLAVA